VLIIALGSWEKSVPYHRSNEEEKTTRPDEWSIRQRTTISCIRARPRDRASNKEEKTTRPDGWSVAQDVATLMGGRGKYSPKVIDTAERSLSIPEKEE
jgi:hypothetical protein